MLERKCIVAVSLLGLLALAASPVLADFVKIHESTEEYYDSGGTKITCSQGCSSFLVGDVTGDVDWKIIDEAWHDTDGDITGYSDSTQVTYTVGNDGYLSDITSFRVPTNGLVPVSISSPDGWTGTYAAGFILWEDDPGIPIGTTKNEFVVIYDELLPIGFAGPVKVDLANSDEFEYDDWVVSTVPAPGAVVIGAIGLGLVYWLKRRFA
jgi:hypothetical protein